MLKCKKLSTIVSACILSIGIFGAGFMIGKALYSSKLLNRTVTVKGIAERDVKSDLGIWEVDYREISNNMVDATKRMQHDQELIVSFLKQKGFVDAEIDSQPVKVEDKYANTYDQNNAGTATAANRYVLTGGIRVRTTRVDLIAQVGQSTNSLLEQGVSLTFDSPNVSPNPSFYYTGLDKIRPEMMADATRSARTVAEQFANDADVKLKGIQRASQGVFQIMGRDTSTMSADWNSNQSTLGSIDKKVRLVTTVDYQIK